MSWQNVSRVLRQDIRRRLAATLPRPCPHCGQDVRPDDAWDVDHLDPVVHHPEAVVDVARLAPAHASCNRAAGAQLRRRVTVPGWSWPW